MKKIVPPKMPTASRKIILMEKGEIIFDVNTESLWVGDGKTPGGLEIGIGVGTVTPVTTVVDADLTAQPGGEYIWDLATTIHTLNAGFTGPGNWVARIKADLGAGVGIRLGEGLSWTKGVDGGERTPLDAAKNILLVDVTDGVGTVSILSIELP